MLDSSQPWSLFGYDLSRTVHYVRSGWSDFLWGADSPVLPLLDETVLAHLEGGEQCHFRAGKPVSVSAPVEGAFAEAVILPERLTLVKTLRIPLAAEPELEAVVGFEVSSSSPFPEADTCFGFSPVSRGESELEVLLVISSRSAVMAYIAEQFGSHDVRAYEVWGECGDQVVVLSGFGEGRRLDRNRRRMNRAALTVVYCLALVVLAAALAAGTKYFELQKVKDIQARVEQSAGETLGLRERLASSRATIAAASDYVLRYPAPRPELARLTTLLNEESWLTSMELRGREQKIEGQSQNAPAIMQQLLDDPAYSRVEAPIAFTKQRSGNERFVLELTLAGAEVPE